MKYIIGVDGGGTKTEAIAYDLEGNELVRGLSGFGNFLVDEEQAKSNIISAIEQCNAKLNKDDCEYIYLGLAGVEVGNNKEKVKEIVSKTFNTKVGVVNDAQLALAALLRGNDGILTIAGTGSISFGINRGVSAITGGWGHLLGDEGSGYSIAIQAFKRMCYEEDNNLDKSILTEKIMKKLEIDKIHSIKNFIYSSTKADIAAITPLIVECANEGQTIALDILKEAGAELAKMTVNLYNKLEFNEDVQIGIRGSVLTKIPAVKEQFITYLDGTIKSYQIIDKEVSSSKGGYYLAKKEMQTQK